MINPMIFYWIDLISSLKTWVVLIMLLFVLGVIAFLLVFLWEATFNEPNLVFLKEWKSKKPFRISVIIAIIFTTLTVVLPDKTTMYKMLVASYVTEENYNIAKSEIVDLIDYISEKIGGGK